MSSGLRTLGKPFITFLVAETTSATGTMVTVVALPLIAIEQLQASAFTVGLLEALQWLPAAILGLLLGALVDRSQQRCRAILVTANFGRMTSLGSLPLAAHLELLTLPVLLVMAFATGVFTAVSQSAFTPYLRQVVPSTGYASANGSMQAGRSTARVVGPAVGGLLVAVIGASNTLLITAACFLICAVALLTIVGQVAPPPPPRRRRLTTEIGEGLTILRSSRVLAWITAGAATANLLLSASGALDILYLSRDLDVPADTIGFILTAGGVGGLTAALISGRLISRYGLGKVATFAFLFTAPASLLLPATQSSSSVVLFAVGIFTVSFGIALGGVALMTLRLHVTPPHLQGRVSSFAHVLSAATIPVGAVLGGTLAELLGTRTALVVLAVSYIAFGVAFACSPLRSIVSGQLPGEGENLPESAPNERVPQRPALLRALVAGAVLSIVLLVGLPVLMLVKRTELIAAIERETPGTLSDEWLGRVVFFVTVYTIVLHLVGVILLVWLTPKVLHGRQRARIALSVYLVVATTGSIYSASIGGMYLAVVIPTDILHVLMLLAMWAPPSVRRYYAARKAG